MATDLFTSHPIPKGGTYTLTTYFGALLFEAEAEYGPRLREWTPIGIEFFDCRQPHIWFPGNRKQVCIRLTSSSMTDPAEAHWQLCQEIVHVLAPVEKATNLEEGMATHFAVSVQKTIDVSAKAIAIQSSPYAAPLDDYVALLSVDPQIITKLRGLRQYFSHITADDILCAAPSCDRALAARLATVFSGHA